MALNMTIAPRKPRGGGGRLLPLLLLILSGLLLASHASPVVLPGDTPHAASKETKTHDPMSAQHEGDVERHTQPGAVQPELANRVGIEATNIDTDANPGKQNQDQKANPDGRVREPHLTMDVVGGLSGQEQKSKASDGGAHPSHDASMTNGDTMPQRQPKNPDADRGGIPASLDASSLTDFTDICAGAMDPFDPSRRYVPEQPLRAPGGAIDQHHWEYDEEESRKVLAIVMDHLEKQGLVLDEVGQVVVDFIYYLYEKGCITLEQIEALCTWICVMMNYPCPPDCPGYYEPPWG